ncbi:MAG: NAD(P)/FAD-dependent oxidoreductase [Chitinophagales bacterium]|nr:NAD(P)/FAD-dependent oxidoreductase [Chitinophagales bacterium]
MNNHQKHVVIIGGGAAGFFAAVNIAGIQPDMQVTILEQTNKLLHKVIISGGGRCNVTHACFDYRELVKNYPRGNKELLSVFARFHPAHTVAWFQQRGVALKTEEDGRMFPATDKSYTIADCLMQEAKRTGVRIIMKCAVEEMYHQNGQWTLITNQTTLTADVVLFATGSSHRAWNLLQHLGHTIVPPVASLFTFHVADPLISGLQGLSVPNATVLLPEHPKFKLLPAPLLITHWGLSGPAVLKLSAFAARELAACHYRFPILVNWCGHPQAKVMDELLRAKQTTPRKVVAANPMYQIPRRLWERITGSVTGLGEKNFADASRQQLQQLCARLTAYLMPVSGKSAFKDEFVTAGGVHLQEVDFKTMQSKVLPNVYFAGEVLDIDAVTGGFNFQAAWSTAWVAAQSISQLI